MKRKSFSLFLLALLSLILCLSVTSCKGKSGGVSKPALTGDETIDLLNSVNFELSKKLSGYYDETGHVAVSDTEAVIAEASAYFSSLAEKGKLTVAEVGTESIVLDLPDGSSAVYTVPQAGMAGGGTDLTIFDFCRGTLAFDENASADWRMEMPWLRHDLYGIGQQYQSILAEQYHTNVIDPNGSFSYCDADSVQLSAARFLDTISAFHTDGVWEIIGHGTCTRSYGTLITSSIAPSPENNALFADDLKNKRVFHTLSGWQTPDDDDVFFLDYPYSHYLLGSKFFDEHLENDALNGAVVYLGVCSGLRDSTLADVFLSKGAQAVYGFDRPVSIIYVSLMADIANILTTRRMELNDHYPDLTVDYRGTGDFRYPSFQETLVIAREVYQDPDPFDTGNEERGRLIMQTNDRDGTLIRGAAACFEGGRGTESEPYIIVSADNLDYMRRYSLDLGISFDDEAGFKGLYMTMINDISAPDFEGFPKDFCGVFDGGGHTIYDLDLSKCKSSAYYHICALFRCLEGGTVCNLTLSGPDVTIIEPSLNIGVFSGKTRNSVIRNCTNKINVYCSSETRSTSAAGITYMTNHSEITECRNEGSIAALTAAGIACDGNDSIIKNCINYGTIRGITCLIGDSSPYQSLSPASAAGIMHTGNSIRIISCENHGTVSADDGYTANAELPGVPAGHTVTPGHACGIFGFGSSTYPVVIENCRNYGTVGKDHNYAAQITFDSGVNVTGCTEQGAVASTPLPPNEPAVVPERPPEEPEKPEESQPPETEEEEKPKEGTIAVGGLYDFDTSDCPSSLTYIVTITQDGELEDKSVESVTNSVICVAAPAMDLSYDHEVIDGAGYLYLTVNWDKPGTYHVSVIVDGSPHSATITVR